MTKWTLPKPTKKDIKKAEANGKREYDKWFNDMSAEQRASYIASISSGFRVNSK